MKKETVKSNRKGIGRKEARKKNVKTGEKRI
jgi:hypothetical protein